MSRKRRRHEHEVQEFYQNDDSVTEAVPAFDISEWGEINQSSSCISQKTALEKHDFSSLEGTDLKTCSSNESSQDIDFEVNNLLKAALSNEEFNQSSEATYNMREMDNDSFLEAEGTEDGQQDHNYNILKQVRGKGNSESFELKQQGSDLEGYSNVSESFNNSGLEVDKCLKDLASEDSNQYSDFPHNLELIDNSRPTKKDKSLKQINLALFEQISRGEESKSLSVKSDSSLEESSCHDHGNDDSTKSFKDNDMEVNACLDKVILDVDEDSSQLCQKLSSSQNISNNVSLMDSQSKDWKHYDQHDLIHQEFGTTNAEGKDEPSVLKIEKPCKRFLFQDVMQSGIIDDADVERSGLCTDEIFAMGLLSGEIAVPNFSTPLKAPMGNVSVCMPLTSVASESFMSSIYSEEEEKDNMTDEEQTSDVSFEDVSDSELFRIVDSQLESMHPNRPDSPGNVSISEDIEGLTQACVMNNVKIHKGSDLSFNEAVFNFMRLYVKNKESKADLQRTIKTICSFLPKDHKMPSTAYTVLKYVKSLAPPVSANIYFYCKLCLFYHGNEIVPDFCCQVCGVKTDMGHFYSYDIAALIKYFFESRNLAFIIDAEELKHSEGFDLNGKKTLKDGSVYRSLNANRGKYDLSLIYGCDGVRVRKGSTRELWLSSLTIAELPIHLQRSFLSVLSVWYDEKKPDMRTFLKPFVDSMENLDHGHETGVEWTHPSTKEVIKSKVRLLVCVLDAPARAITQNVQLFNGRYGCNTCEVKTQLSHPTGILGQKRMRVYYYAQNLRLRTQERMQKHAELAQLGGKVHVKGVKGPSILSRIPSVDISKCIVPEYLHSVLLGVTKQQISIWIEKQGDWSLKRSVTQIDHFLKSFKHPSFVHRCFRQLKKLKFWKASDFYYFLLFESLPALSGHLPDMYFQHYTLLVKGVFTLLKTFNSESEIDEADMLLKLYVSDFEKLYGTRELTSNLHQLLHLGLCVRRYGPLHCWSAFPFEDLNGMVARTTHGTKHVDVEIVANIKICHGIHILQNVLDRCDGLNVSNTSFCEGEFLGKHVSTSTPDELFGVISNDDQPKIYFKAKLGYDTFTSERHKNNASSENFYVLWKTDNVIKYGSIKYFAETKDGRYIVLTLFTVKNTQLFYHRETLTCIEHIVPVEETSHCYVSKLNDIVSSIEKVGKINSYFYKRPNLYRYVL